MKQAFECLGAEERVRLERFVTPQLQRRYGVCRGRLRMLLAAFLKSQPSSVAFEYGNLGKPHLGSSGNLHFNVSHSQDWALMAFARQCPVGVDIEFYDRRMDEQAIANQLLSETEFVQWKALPVDRKRHAILSTWVAKEAILKSLGLGITTSLQRLELPHPIPMNSFSVTLDSMLIENAEAAHPLSIRQPIHSNPRSVHFIENIPNGIAAVCFDSHIDSFEMYDWDEIASGDNLFDNLPTKLT
jgi:phosphopantetheinyl transferase